MKMKFLNALLTFIRMYRRGFYFSENMHTDADGTYWGFFRFNSKNDNPGLFDIDCSFGKKHRSYFHVHGDDFRMEW